LRSFFFDASYEANTMVCYFSQFDLCRYMCCQLRPFENSQDSGIYV